MADRSRSNAALVKSTAIGTVLQVLMVVAGHYSPAVSGMFAAGGMGISGVAGLLYTVLGGKSTPLGAAGGGAVAGGVSAFLGILVSYLLGDVPAGVLGFGTAGSAVTGAIGGVLGRLLGPKPGAAH
jgi:hypothetical protein